MQKPPASKLDSRGTPLSDQAYELIRKAVLRGDVAPGSRLKIETFQREFAFSSSPLREALNRLTAEGLVDSDERRGFRVAGISMEDMRDLTAFRLNIETISLRESIERGDDHWESAIVAAFHRLERLEARANDEQFSYNDEWSERHKEFHMALISRCPSLRQISVCSNLFDHVERYRRFSISFRKTKRDNAGEHRSIMRAALRRDGDQASLLLRRHIEKTAVNVGAMLAAREAGGVQKIASANARDKAPRKIADAENTAAK